MKAVFRHYSSVLLMMGIMVSFYSFMNGANIYKKIQDSLVEVNKIQYKYTYSMYISGVQDVDMVIDELKRIQGNVFLAEDTVYVDEDSSYHTAEILISQKEELPYYVNVIDRDGLVVIGSDLYGLCKKKDGKVSLKIGGESYSIKGITSSENSDILNYKLVITVNEKTVKQFVNENQDLTLECGSNNIEIMQDIQNFYKRNSDKYNIYFERVDDKYIEVGSSNSDEKFYFVIAVFAIVNCVSLSEFWIMRRKKEMIIRKLFGFSNLRLFKMLYLQMLKICITAIIFVSIVQGFVNWIKGYEVVISIYKIGITCAFLMITSLIIIAVPTYKASHYKLERGEV